MADRDAHFHCLLGVAVENDLLGTSFPGGLSGPRLAHLKEQLGVGLRAEIPHDCLHPNGLAGNLGRSLHADNVRRPRQDQLNGIEQPRDVAYFLIIPARSDRWRQGFACGPDSDD